MNTVQRVATISLVQEQAAMEKLYGHLEILQEEYPRFREWYFEKVVPECALGIRKIYVASCGDDVAGILILKDSDQKKICTLRVHPEYRRMGIGHQLMDRAIAELRHPRPLISVSDDHVGEFSKLFDEYGFQLFRAWYGLYRANHWEFVYNGPL